MKKQIFAYVLFSLAFLFSCSDENLISSNSSNGKYIAKSQKFNNRIDMKEAMSQVEEAIAFLDKEHPSESKSIRAVNSVSILRFGDVKSSIMKSKEYAALDISDTLAYVFNFGDSSGFAIISNDVRIESPLLAFAEKGSLVNGETDNPGLKLFLERLEGYMLESIAKYGKAGEEKAMGIGDYFTRPTPLDTIVRPLVPVKWGQAKPFNNNLAYGNCPNTGNGKYPAGCVATAVAQIMSYWEYPPNMGGIGYNWKRLNFFKDSSYFEALPTDDIIASTAKGFARAMVADLFQRISTSININFYCKGSGAYPSTALAFLASKGFSTQNLKPYDLSTVRDGLLLKRPFMATGCPNEGKCHTWVIDGLAKNSNNSYYIHNNWGVNNGFYDSYSLSGVFRKASDTSSYNNVEIAAVYR